MDRALSDQHSQTTQSVEPSCNLITSDLSSPVEMDIDLTRKSEIICFLQKCNKLASASFNILTFEVKILDSSESYQPEYPLIEIITSQLNPLLVLYNRNAPQEFIRKIQKCASYHQCSYQQLPSTLFNYTSCKEFIFSTNFSGLLDKCNYINTVINTSDERLIGALGALFSQLKDTLLATYLSPSVDFTVKSISTMSFKNIVWIDNETYKCLQIFEALQHPSAFKWSNQPSIDNSQGLSIYSIIEKNCSLLGSSKLRHFLSSPTKDFITLKKRHEVINFCRNPVNAKLVETLKTQMNHLSPVYVLMGNVECANVRGKHWKCIYQNIYYSVLLAETCKENSTNVQLFREVGSNLIDEMYAMAYHLDRIIDFQSMEGSEIFIVKPGVCQILEKAKDKFSKLIQAINKVVPYEFDAVPNYIKKIHMLYIPEMKFLLSIPYWKKSLNKQELELPGLEYKFTSNKTAYYKSKRCYALDSLLGDPQIEIMTEEANIIRALGKYIKNHIHHTYFLIEKLAELDCILSLGYLAKEYDYVEPVLKNDKELTIIDGVHPLLKICTNSFIPNSIESSPEKKLLKIIYGPNSSGKTVYVKQVALLTYMTHIGSFIPAREASIGMFSHIHTHLSSSESIISHSSSFMNDIRKLVCVLNNCSSNSLLILDELGKGTTELNGVAILASCINYLLSLGAPECPHVLISTHLSPLHYYIRLEPPIFSLHVMDYTIEDGKYIFLYSVKDQEVIITSDELNPFPDIPILIASSAKRVLSALRSGEGVIPCTLLRLKKCQSYYAFLKRFSSINANREGLIEKLRRKLKTLVA